MTFLATGRWSAGPEIPIEILRMRGGRIVKEQIEKMWREVVVEDR
jgi:hypothetical protein